MIVYQSWCHYCSRGWQDKRWLQVEDNIITCTSCNKRSEIVPDPKDKAFFYLKRLDNAN